MKYPFYVTGNECTIKMSAISTSLLTAASIK